MNDDQVWKRCSSCKKPIACGSTFYECSVSTCTRKRTGFVFCSVDCWEIHLPMMRHREAWAVEERAPSQTEWAQEQRGEPAAKSGAVATAPGAVTQPVVRRREGSEPTRRQVVGTREPVPSTVPREVLVVAARLKAYIRARYHLNTSDGVLEVLSDELRRLCDRAVDHAREDGRKTVLERDFEWLGRR
jgi:hypothetical protein